MLGKRSDQKGLWEAAVDLDYVGQDTFYGLQPIGSGYQHPVTAGYLIIAYIPDNPSIVWTMTTCRSTLTSPEKRLCSCGTVRETNGWSAVECGLEPLAKG